VAGGNDPEKRPVEVDRIEARIPYSKDFPRLLKVTIEPAGVDGTRVVMPKRLIDKLICIRTGSTTPAR
jgi:hypothetical protein